MPSIDPKTPITKESHAGTDAPLTDADPGDVNHFEEALRQNPSAPRQGGFFEQFTVDSSKPHSIFESFTVTPKVPDSPATDEVIDLDTYEPEQPVVPTPEEKKSNFLEGLWSGVKKGLDSVKEFLAKPETAKFVRAANIVFAGAMVVAAGVLFATGVGAPVAIAALALAGGAGLAMQLPAVHDKLLAGVVALMAPVLGQETAEKLGPVVTQGLISGIMIAIVATGGQAGSAQGALDAAVGVFNSMKDVFNGIAQVYEAGAPVLEMLGVDVNSQALKEMAAVFGTMGALMPDLSSFSEGLGVSLKNFLANPDMDAFKKFLSTVKDVPESLSQLIDSDFLKGLGGLIDGGEKFITEFQSKDLLNNFTGLLQLLDQGAKLAKA